MFFFPSSNHFIPNVDFLFWEGRCFLCTVLRKNILYDQCLQNSSKCKYFDIFLWNAKNLLHKAPKCVSTEARCINIRVWAINLSVFSWNDTSLHKMMNKQTFIRTQKSIKAPNLFEKKNWRVKCVLKFFSHFLHLLFSLDDWPCQKVLVKLKISTKTAWESVSPLTFG